VHELNYRQSTHHLTFVDKPVELHCTGMTMMTGERGDKGIGIFSLLQIPLTKMPEK
jgi:hypothetical protein